jgi:hypothetical protein
VPELTFVGGHPTVADPDRPGERVCVCCERMGGFLVSRCVPGLVVHLIDQLEIDEDPDTWAGSPWVTADALTQARKWWTDRGTQITRAPQGHPRFLVCPTCTVSRMHAGELRFTVPQPRPPIIIRK